MAFTFTQLVADSFQRSNEDPLGPSSLWQTFFGPTDHPVIKNNECQITLSPDADGGATNLTALPNDQWVEIEWNDLNVLAEVNLYLRGGRGSVPNEPVPCYRLIVFGQAFNSSVNSGYLIDQVASNGGSITHAWTGTVPYVFQKGDKIRFFVIGDAVTGKLYFQVNGVLLFTGNLSDSPIFLASGKAAFQLASLGSPQAGNDIGIINFQAGGAAIQSSATIARVVNVDKTVVKTISD